MHGFKFKLICPDNLGPFKECCGNFLLFEHKQEQQDKKDVAFLIIISENTLNINKTSLAFTFITFTTQKLNKNKIRLFYSLLVIFCDLFLLLLTSYKLVYSWPSFARNPAGMDKL